MKKLIKILNYLGDTPEKIAKEFEIREIKGQQEDPCYCPIANYLRMIGNCKAVYVKAGSIKVVFRNNLKSSISLSNNYYHIKNFIYDFDNGEYPYLIKD